MIKINWFPEEIIRIAKKIEEKNGELFLVGGSVRDLILKRRPEEYDFEIYGNFQKKQEYLSLPELEKEEYVQDFIINIKETLKEFGEILEYGKSFGVIKMANKPYDFSFPRTENKTGVFRQDYAISLNPFLEYVDAQKRRDITINTIMYSLSREILIDNYKGLQDIQLNLIRHVDADTFIEDPLRVYRVAQFVSRFSFTVDMETMELCQSMDINNLSLERIQWEMEKLLKGKDILAGVKFLEESKALLKRHFNFHNLLYNNMSKYDDINRIHYFIEENMKMTERFAFILILFGNNFKNTEFEDYHKEIERVLLSFTNNKKDINQTLERIYNLKLLIDYYNENMDYQEVVYNLINKDLKYLELYFKFLYGENEEIKKIINEARNFKQLVKGKDLMELGIIESVKYKEILSEAIKMQISGKDKKEILLHIKRRELL